MPQLIDRFKEYIAENDLLGPSDRVLVAVSGGVDSMVMLSLFAASGWSVGVAHCNFGLRGAEGDEDTQLVENEAKRYGLQCFGKRFDTAAEMEKTGESVQMAARRLRYDWFNELSTEHGYTAIAIAHQADDSVETFFINLFRGTGLRGLTGISKTSGRVVRPLLFATRREISDYAQTNKIAYREDSSNRSTKYLRNKIRLGLVPRLREINPRFTEMMYRNVGRLTEAQGFIDAAIGRIRDEIVHQNGETVTVDPARIDPAYPVEFVVYELLNSGWGFKGDVIDGIVEALERGGSGRRFYARDHVAYIDRGRIVIEPVTDDDVCEVTFTEGMGRVYAGNSVYYLQLLDIDHVESLSVPENTALLDADLLRWPMSLRRWREGDRFVPLGMAGSKKVSDYLIDTKISVPEKQRQFVMVNGAAGGPVAAGVLEQGAGGVNSGTDGGFGGGHSSAEEKVGGYGQGPMDGRETAAGGLSGEIVWLTGRRVDDRFKIGPKTENVLKIVREIL